MHTEVLEICRLFDLRLVYVEDPTVAERSTFHWRTDDA